MKKTITLKVEWLDAKKLKKADELAAREALFKSALKTFKLQMKDVNFKITKEISEDYEIIIDFDETNWEKMNIALIAADIVLTIDSFIQGD